MVNSPATTITTGHAFTTNDTSLYVDELAVFPAAPNIVVIGDGEDAVTYIYSAKSAASGAGYLTIPTDPQEGTENDWPVGTTCSRMLTAYDLATVHTNIAFVKDHGNLDGLSDDDHTQYIKHSLATATSDFLAASGSGAFIKKTLAETQAILVSTTTKRSVVLTAAGGWPLTTGGCAANAKSESSTNKRNYYTLDFDKDTDESAEWMFVLPDNYDGGTITAIPYWTAASGSGTVCFAISGRAYANDAAIDQALGTAQSSKDTLITAGDVHVGPETSAITLAGSPAGGQLVAIRCMRDVSEDNLGVDAKLIALKIEYGINAWSD